MGSDQHFCLRWNNFHSNIAASFEHLRDHEEFVDVTLACEGRSLKAHKIVLSACSPYFKNLLKQNPCQHPIIILRDVAFPDLSALLNFVYQGEVYVSQDRLPAFLRTAEMLHIKGLTDQNHQSSNSAHPTCPPVSIGPPSSTTIFQATHDQGVLCNKVSILGVPLTSPRSQTPPSPSSHSQHHHISPPPKKRRSATTITALPSGSPTTTAPPTPTSSSTPPRMELFTSSREDGLGGHLDGSTLAAALMKPLSGSGRSEVIVTPSRPSLHPSSVLHHDALKVKQEVEEISQNDIKEEGDEEVNQAVNLVTEGSILRQRIQGYRGSPDAPLPLSLNSGNGRLPPLSALSTSISHEDSASEDGFFGGGDTGGEGGGDDSEQEKEALAASPMVIRSPLGGILQREGPGLFGGAGTSGSLSHHDSSQDADFLVRACVPKLWNSRQPGICPICNRVFSNKFNLKQHIINIHTKGEGVECDMCHKKCKNKWYLRRHQVTHHGAPLKRNRSFPIEHYVNDENDHGMKDLPSG